MLYYFYFRDKRKQEALWQKTFEIVGKYLTEEEIAGMKGTWIVLHTLRNHK